MAGPNRVPLPDTSSSPGLFQVMSFGDSSSDQQIWEYKRRRPHRKSKGGCQGCKQRRVRCDQAMPVCLRCRRNQRSCVYEGGAGGSGESSSGGSLLHEQKYQDGTQETPATITNSTKQTSGTAATRQPARQSTITVPIKREYEDEPQPIPGSHPSPSLISIAKSGPAIPQLPRFVRAKVIQTPAVEYGTPAEQLIHHFDLAGDGIFDMPNFVGPLIPLCVQFPHLRGTILAAAASHLSHKAPWHADYQIAKHYQGAVALRDYQTALNTPLNSQGQLGVDVLLITALLINMMSFNMPLDEGDPVEVWDSRQGGSPPPCADPDPDPRRSWVFGTHENRLSWLALQLGLTPLLIATAPWREHSRLRLLYANSDDERRTLSGTWQSLGRVPPNWIRLFGLNPKSTPLPGFRGSGVTTPAPDSTPGCSPSTAGSSPDSTVTDTISEADHLYRVPLRVVAELRLVKAHDRNLLQYFQFLGQLNNDFRHKLLERDEKALWLFGMWMGLLCRFPNVWWTRRRSRCDFRAIRLWLHLVGVDRRPGEEGQMWRHLLQDLDDTWGYNFATDPIMHRAQSSSVG